MFKRIALIVLVGISLVAACTGNQAFSLEPPAAPMPEIQVSQNSVSGAPVDDGRFYAGASGDTDAVQNGESQQERVVLMSASLSVVVEAADDMLEEITHMAQAMDGWVVTSNSYQTTTAGGEEVTRASITIRIPADHFNETLDNIKAGAQSVKSENVSGQDVTQEYVDLTSRLHNLEAAETQLQSIMEDARRTEDVLTVYTELVRVRGDIEVLRGQIRYYDESAAYSSITIDLIPTALETPIQIAGWSPSTTVQNALGTLLNVLRFIVDTAITLIVLVLPLALLVGIPGWLIYRTGKRRGWLRPAPKLESPPN